MASPVDLDTLVAGRDWDGIASLLVSFSRDPGLEAELHSMLAGLFGHGRVRAPAEAMAHRGEALPLVLRLFLADAIGRDVGLHEYQLDDLRRELDDRAPDPELSLWLSAMDAEHYLWQADLSSFTIASSALYGSSDLELGPLGLIGRGRLRRTMAIAEVVMSPTSASNAKGRNRCDAEADFEAAGCRDQIIFSRSLFGLMTAALAREEASNMALVVRRSVVDASVLGSDLLGPQWLMLTWTAILAWDLQMARLALGEATDLNAQMFAEMRDAAIAVVELVETEGAASVAESVRGLGQRLRTRPLMMQSLAIFVCGVLLDAGHVEIAQEFLPSPVASSPMPEVTLIDLETVRVRRDLLIDPGESTVSAAEEIIQANIRTNGERVAGSSCLKFAYDCARIGRIADAMRLRRRAQALLPRRSRLTARERWYTDRLDARLAARARGR